MMIKRRGLYGPTFLLILALLITGCSPGQRQKVFVLGIDGLTFDLLIPWAQEGKLPHFARLLEEGSSTQLISAVPPFSPPAWTSAITGVNPGKHGIFGFIKDIQATADGRPNLIYYTSRDRMADPLWVILSERGRRSVVVNVPATSPPDKVKGVMISGFPHTSLTNFTYPPEYRFKIPNYRKDIYGQEVSVEENEDFLRDLMDITVRREKVVFKLMEEEPWELFFVTFTITDRVQHYFWKFMDPQHPDWTSQHAQLYGDAILKAYQKMDEFLGELRSRLDAQTTLLIMSDHGFGPIYQPINGENFLNRLMPSGDFQVVSADQFGATFHLITQKDPPYDRKTRESYIRTKELLRNKLEQLTDPSTGKRVIQKVFDRKDLYWGPYVNMAPDLLGLEVRGYLFWNWNPREGSGIFLQKEDPIFEHFLSGFHLMNGVLIMAGANVQGEINNFDAHIFDIAPTVLYLLGEPVPQEMDGKILDAPISQEYLASHALDARWVRSTKSRQMEEWADSTEAINKYIEEQLKAIGYVQ